MPAWKEIRAAGKEVATLAGTAILGSEIYDHYGKIARESKVGKAYNKMASSKTMRTLNTVADVTGGASMSYSYMMGSGGAALGLGPIAAAGTYTSLKCYEVGKGLVKAKRASNEFSDSMNQLLKSQKRALEIQRKKEKLGLKPKPYKVSLPDYDYKFW